MKLGKEKMTLNKPKKKRLTVESVVVFSFHPDLFQFDFQHRESPTLLISDRGGKLSQLVFLSQIGDFLFFKGALELVSLCIQSHLAAFIHIRAAVSKERVRELFLETGVCAVI